MLLLAILQSPTITAQEPQPAAAPQPAYRIGPGDHLSVAYTFKSPAPVAIQRVQPGDRLVASYHFDIPDPNRPYKLAPGDELYIDFTWSPELSKLYYNFEEDKTRFLSSLYLIQPEGTLYLHGIEEPIKVIDHSTTEVAQMLRALVTEKGLLVDAEVNVSVEPKYKKHTTLKELFQMVEDHPVSFMTAAVGLDGKLNLPLVFDIDTTGKTITQVSEEFTRAYHDKGFYLVTVTLMYESVNDPAHDTLMRLLNQSDNPIGLEVLPSGEISLPLLPQYPAAGKTPAELSADLTAHYSELGMNRAQVSVWIAQPRARTVQVMGAVGRAGAFPFNGEERLWGAVAQAGGLAAGADPAAVRIFRAGAEAPLGPFSFANFLQSADPAANPPLAADDLIVVPAKSDTQ